MNNKKTSSAVIHFGIKSSCYLLLACMFGGIFIPYLFYLLHWEVRLGILLFLPVSLATVITSNHYFISTKKGITKGCIRTFFFATACLMIVAYLWLYKGIIF
ncbi:MULTISPECIES: hypothetical protein [unclassified Enterococcus]|uniref:hypothetical protein n=1 Tax=unclassified Enterococcus TaxID=2608891 RepID=UPI001A90D73A|nr:MULTISPECIES: hypothetical protein [unclassified Enterococcus]MBO0460371.1 hypothetical protein [Enterococcus sp. DIV1298c]MBO1298806.1 hypothetical protein [Enterococcus sp. DIV1271a]